MARLDDDVSSTLPVDPDLVAPLKRGQGRLRRRRPRAQAIIVVSVGVGGSIGALARYGLSLLLSTSSGHFPTGTFVINVTGSAVLGFLLVLLMEQFPRGRLARLVLGTGFIGAYTTFSTFMVETDLLVRDGHVLTAVVYALGSAVAGLFAVMAGIVGARAVMRMERSLQEVN
ncbi:MAG: fluoride efflux transporter CrcB [Acidimicrobiales bacterium]